MKNYKNNFTTPEQSKRLLALGVPADSADCWLTMTDEIFEDRHRPHVRTRGYEIANSFFELRAESVLPCWSVGRLIEIYVIARGVDTSYLPIERGEDMVEYLIRLYKEKVKDLDFSKLEE